MKAFRLHSVGDLRFEAIPEPNVKPGWCLVQVKAAGICSSDISRVFGKGMYHYPTVPGHEFSGVVVKASSGEERILGKRVGVFPLIPCGDCAFCKEGKYELCENYDYVGSRRDGGFAEYCLVPIWNLVELPDCMSFEEAAMLEPLSVALHAVKKLGDNLNGMQIAVVGTGMIGFAGAQWAKMLGADNVTVIGRTEAKRRIADLIEGVDYISQRDLSERAVFDGVLEAVGTSESIARSIEIARPGGVIALMGNPAGSIRLSQDVFWRVVRKELTLTGSWNSRFAGTQPSEWTEVVETVVSKGIAPQNLITHILDATQLMSGLCLMRDHSEPYCKVMVVWGER